MAAERRSGSLVSRCATEFPKVCANCGRFYPSEDEYLTETEGMHGAAHNGFREVSDESGPFLEVFRNCVCGSTLMSLFESRRDVSEKGDRRRKLFDDCLNAMVTGGIPVETARIMLRNLIRNDA